MNILRIQLELPSYPPRFHVIRSRKYHVFTCEISVNHPELSTVNLRRACERYEEEERLIDKLNMNREST